MFTGVCFNTATADSRLPGPGPPEPRRRRAGTALGALVTLLLFSAATQLLPAQISSPGRLGQKPSAQLVVVVTDENAIAVSASQILLRRTDAPGEAKGETDYAGKCEFPTLEPGTYRVRVEKEGFYVVEKGDVRVGETERLEVILNHQQEYRESVNVIYAAPAIQPEKTTSSQALDRQEIIGLPFSSVTRDIRYALPLLPGILRDAFGQVHVNGSSTRQVQDQLDGFNITDPVNGLFAVRVSVDALRSVEVQGSRYPVEFGKGSGGVASLRTGMGDDHHRFSATDFIPSLQKQKGIHVNTWTPRGTFSGPLRRGKAWFLLAPEGEYNVDVVNELPKGADRATTGRLGNLAKTQINLTQAHILTASVLVNGTRRRNFGLSRFDPIETTVDVDDAAYLFTVKDLSYFSSGTLLEIGLAGSRFSNHLRPQGNLPYVISPEGTRGNFFESEEAGAHRLQGIVNLILPPVRWRGRHEFKTGIDVVRVTYDQSFDRRPFTILREDGTVSRQITFIGNPDFQRNNLELSGYFQDRWSASDRWLVESGVRFDWDQVVRRPLLSPRVVSSYLLRGRGDTKITWGVGTYYDASSLEFITRPLTGQRLDFFYDPTGQALIGPPVETSFHVNERSLRQTWFVNWSVGLEQKLPAAVSLRLEFIRKRGRDGWTFINEGLPQAGTLSGVFRLENKRRDRYDSLDIALRRSFAGGHFAFASYTRSTARSNAVLNFNLENPLFSQQAGGPLPWDSPDRFLSWGLLPFVKAFDLGYGLDWRDGFPFSLFNQGQRLVGAPGSRRFPNYFSLNLSLERRIHLFGCQWALRAAVDNVTNRHNPTVVNSNVDSPHFLTFAGSETRGLTGRIRFLGRK